MDVKLVSTSDAAPNAASSKTSRYSFNSRVAHRLDQMASGDPNFPSVWELLLVFRIPFAPPRTFNQRNKKLASAA